MNRSSASLGQQTAWLSWFIFANGLFALLAGLRYLPWMNIPDTQTAAYVALLYPGQFALLAWLGSLPLLIVSLIFPFRRSLTILSVVSASLGIALLAIDTVAYSLYRFHLSSFVVELALGGGTEIFFFSWQLWTTAVATFAGILFIESVTAFLLWRKRPRARWLGAAFALMIGLQIGAHGWHAWADTNYDTRITGITRHVPLYYGASAKRVMKEYGLVDPQKVRENQSGQILGSVHQGNQLNYPTQPLQCSEPARKLNVLMIIIEGARWDMLDPQWMPNIYEFAENNLIFEEHYSNGNATKPGVFTLFYSLPASYWGHGSNFGQYQLRVPMVVHWPGEQAQRIDYRTDNFDIAPTLMKKALGCTGAPARYYTTGNGLFSSFSPPWTIAHSYMDYALLTENLR